MKKPLFNKFKSKSEDFVKKVRGYDFSSFTDEQLQAELKGDLYACSAACCEVIKRLTGLSLFDSQLKTAFGLYSGNICELATGEGKTLAAVLAAVLFNRDNRRVSILVFNDYLAARDGRDNKKIFDFCGITCGYITAESAFKERQAAYASDVVYVSAKEAGFDYLRNFLAVKPEEYLTMPFDVAIVDEADSILIDEAGIPLVLAGTADDVLDYAATAFEAVSSLTEEDVGVNLPENQVWLNDSGLSKIESKFEIDNLYLDENFRILTAVNMALEAAYLLRKDKEYIVKDGSIKVIDESTGRIAVGRRFPDALQRAVEVKEGLRFEKNSKIYNTITIQSFMELYKTLCGMTGTAKTSAREFYSMYGRDTVVVEPHTPCIRIDREDRVFDSLAQKRNAVLDCIKEAYAQKRPVLLGTSSVAESEWYSENLDIPHEVLNARNDEREAEIIADAGLPARVTISTNMAGRGVDIKLGGHDERARSEVVERGGLLVLSSGINRSRRIDNQLRGRAGRQGDPGESIFFVSLEDENIAPFIEIDKKSKLSQQIREAQKILEGNQAEARYMLHKYSLIIEDQRKIVNNLHDDLLFGEQPADFLKKDRKELFKELTDKYPEKNVLKAENQLLLYFSVQCFADYLETMEDVRNGIHLVIVGGKNPLDEYNRLAISNFEEMKSDVKQRVAENITKYEITDNGIDMLAAGLSGASSTWSYMVDENTSQFSRLPELLKMFSGKIKKSVFSLSDYLDDKLNKR